MARMFLAVLVFLAMYALLNVYVGQRIWVLFDLMFSPANQTLTATVFAVCYGLVAFSYVFSRIPQWPRKVRTFCHVIGAWYIAVFYYLLLMLPLYDLARLLFVRQLQADSNVVTLVCAAFVFVTLCILFAKGRWNAVHPIVRHYSVTLNADAERLLPARSIRIAVASDFHLGDLVGRTRLATFLQAMRDHQPDLILLPGDIVDDDPQAFVAQGMDQMMRELPTLAPLGVYAVLGNHEYYGGQIESYVALMKQLGIPVLRDEAVCVADSFYVVGRKDYTAGRTRMTPAQLTETLDRRYPILMMDHQPRQFAAAQEAGVDLLFCGHTHRGQFAPNHLITKRLFELDWGYMLKERMHVFVSSGFGTWGPPIRLASRAEWLLIELEFAKTKV
jgi:predicted MPP superfamily phosphohydrolase